MASAKFALAPTFLSMAHTLDYNCRINELTAAVGLVWLETITDEIQRLADNPRLHNRAER